MTNLATATNSGVRSWRCSGWRVVSRPATRQPPRFNGVQLRIRKVRKMRVKFADKVEAVADVKYESGRLRPPIAKLFAAAGILVPSTGKLDIAQVDIALKNLSIEQRMTIKSELAAVGVIA